MLAGLATTVFISMMTNYYIPSIQIGKYNGQQLARVISQAEHLFEFYDVGYQKQATRKSAGGCQVAPQALLTPMKRNDQLCGVQVLVISQLLLNLCTSTSSLGQQPKNVGISKQ